MVTKPRHVRILDLLRGEPTVLVRDLARRLEVSESTIRRDLDELTELGLVRRLYGGAPEKRGRARLEGKSREFVSSSYDNARASLVYLLVDSERRYRNVRGFTRADFKRLRDICVSRGRRLCPCITAVQLAFGIRAEYLEVHLVLTSTLERGRAQEIAGARGTRAHVAAAVPEG